MKTLQLNWGLTVHKMSAPVECMTAVGTIRRNRLHQIIGVNLKFNKRLHPDEVARLLSRRASCQKKMEYKVAPHLEKEEYCVLSVLRECGSNTPATVIIQDEAGNCAGNSQGMGMNAWGSSIHTSALNAFIGREAFINMDDVTQYKPDKKPVYVKKRVQKTFRYKVRDARVSV